MGTTDRLSWIALYWAEDDDGEIQPTKPENVGSRPAKWTTFLFSTVPTGHESDMAPLQTAVLLTGEHAEPSGVVIREAEFALFGATVRDDLHDSDVRP